jgi:DNA-binding XRE family transcriptional regulator
VRQQVKPSSIGPGAVGMPPCGVGFLLTRPFRCENVSAMKLRQYLKKENLSLEEFAKKVNSSSSTIYRVATGNYTPKLDLAKRIVVQTQNAVTFEDL